MKVTVIKEVGYEEALFGVGLSHGLTTETEKVELSDVMLSRLEAITRKLAVKDGGHNKFLESIVVWIDINAPRYWWQEFDTYRVGMTKQSESTMHTIHKRVLVPSDFEGVLKFY